MQTQTLYYTNPRLLGCDATILAIEQGSAASSLVLDRSVFYPEGGGQPCDLGTIGGIPLGSVVLEGGKQVHRLSRRAEPWMVPGARVALVLDGGRRRDHSEQHTGQHLLSATLLRLFGNATKSFHLGAERSTIDVDGPFVDGGCAQEAESAVNEAIAEDFRVVTHLCPPEDLRSFPLRRLPPSGQEAIRVVEIDGLDHTPCCGTHARSTGELRLIVVTGTERYKGMTRVEFMAGNRAVDHGRASAKAAREGVKALGCPLEELGAEAGRLASRLKAAQSQVRALVKARARTEAGILLAAASAKGEKVPIVMGFEDRDADAALEACKAIAEGGRVAIAASFPESTVCVIAPSPLLGLGERLAAPSASLGGKGGGGPAFFRATFPERAAMEEFMGLVTINLQN